MPSVTNSKKAGDVAIAAAVVVAVVVVVAGVVGIRDGGSSGWS